MILGMLEHLGVELCLDVVGLAQIDPFSSPCTNIKSKCIKDFNIKPETLKLIEESQATGHRGKFPEQKMSVL